LSLASHLNRAWLRKGPLACTLWPLSMLMRAIVAMRREAYRRGWLPSERLPVPVLVVGNRVVGGAGKTPTTIALLAHLKARGWTPGVLSRGYKASSVEGHGEGPLLIDAGTADKLSASATGDEPLLIWRRTGAPLMVGRDRATGGRALMATHPEINLLVCDDGLQHLKLRRDIEVIVFDDRGAGNGWLLPAGPLREPIDVAPQPGLVAEPLILYNAAHASTRLKGHLARRGMAPLQALSEWWRPQQPGQSSHTLRPSDLGPQAPAIWAIAGIAQPQRFFDALLAQGFAIKGVALDDHSDFGTLPWPSGVSHVIVTEKDAVKLPLERVASERPGTQVWVAALDFAPEDSFWTALDAALARLTVQPTTSSG
jgi:tetraacyldisaccharide 4'-kinase